MSAYSETSKIGAKGVRLILPFLKETSLDGQLVTTDKGRLSEELQKKYGDIFMNNSSGNIIAVEVKTEVEQKTQNFFLETWSNRSRRTVGWMFALDADILIYLFWDTKTFYSIPFKKLQVWSFDKASRLSLTGRIYDYIEKPMKKYDQLNDTYGRCVPIADIEREVGFRRYRQVAGIWKLDDEPLPPKQAGQGTLFQ